MKEKTFPLENLRYLKLIFGPQDIYVKMIEEALKVKISLKSDYLLIKGSSQENIKKTINVLKEMYFFAEKNLPIKKSDVAQFLKFSSRDNGFFQELKDYRIEVFSKKKFITPKTKGQLGYVKAIHNYDIVFSLGPAGTGKTYLAMGCAVSFLMKNKVSRIILVRPAKEAGESLGFLPGDVTEKLGPYLRPLYDALYDMMEPERIEEYTETRVIEVAPLAYMRGRTLNDAFIILDEAQNCTSEQMKMFLTRLGFGSKAVITGDLTQSDLPRGRPEGLMEAIEVLKDIKGIKFVYLTGEDVVRHFLVQEIIEAYDKKKKS